MKGIVFDNVVGKTRGPIASVVDFSDSSIYADTQPESLDHQLSTVDISIENKYIEDEQLKRDTLERNKRIVGKFNVSQTLNLFR